MKQIVLRSPVVLYETVEALYQHVNGLFGNWDAAECAAEYAKLNTALYPCLAVLGTVCSVAYDGIDVRCCFGQNRTRYYLSGTVRLSTFSCCLYSFSSLLPL